MLNSKFSRQYTNWLTNYGVRNNSGINCNSQIGSHCKEHCLSTIQSNMVPHKAKCGTLSEAGETLFIYVLHHDFDKG